MILYQIFRGYLPNGNSTVVVQTANWRKESEFADVTYIPSILTFILKGPGLGEIKFTSAEVSLPTFVDDADLLLQLNALCYDRPHWSTEQTLSSIDIKLDDVITELQNINISSDISELPQVLYDNSMLNISGELRVIENKTIFDLSRIRDARLFYVDRLLLGNYAAIPVGTYPAHSPNTSCTVMSVTAGQTCIEQTTYHAPYQPGKPFRILMTGILSDILDISITARLGYFDDTINKNPALSLQMGNGIFFELSNGIVYIFIRTYTSGSQTNYIKVAQSAWNVDKLDGTGPSGITIDWTKCQLFVMEFLWLGVGSIRYGTFVNNKFIICHIVNNTNQLLNVYMSEANLPIRQEISSAIGGVAANAKIICWSVSSEGKYNPRGQEFKVSTLLTPKQINHTTWVPVIVLRKKTTHSQITINPLSYKLGVTTNADIAIMIIKNPTTLTGASWISGPIGTAHEYDISATAYTGGTILHTDWFTDTSDEMFSEFENKVIYLGSKLNGETESLLIVARKYVGTGNENVSATLRFQEWY